MGQLIEFGGTNDVDVLHLHMAGDNIDYGTTMNLTEQAPNVTTQQTATPQVDVVAVQRTGVHGRRMVGHGYLHAPDHESLNGIEDSIDLLAKSGPTRLVNSVTSRTYWSVVIESWRKIARRWQAAGGDLVQEFEIVFLDVRP